MLRNVQDVLAAELDLEAALTLLRDHSRVDRFPGKDYAPSTSPKGDQGDPLCSSCFKSASSSFAF